MERTKPRTDVVDDIQGRECMKTSATYLIVRVNRQA